MHLSMLQQSAHAGSIAAHRSSDSSPVSSGDRKGSDHGAATPSSGAQNGAYANNNTSPMGKSTEKRTENGNSRGSRAAPLPTAFLEAELSHYKRHLAAAHAERDRLRGENAQMRAATRAAAEELAVSNTALHAAEHRATAADEAAASVRRTAERRWYVTSGSLVACAVALGVTLSLARGRIAAT